MLLRFICTALLYKFESQIFDMLAISSLEDSWTLFDRNCIYVEEKEEAKSGGAVTKWKAREVKRQLPLGKRLKDYRTFWE